MEVRTTKLQCILALVFVVVLPKCYATTCTHQTIKHSASHNGYITSPNYPDPYLPYQCIIWVFFGTPRMKILLMFRDFDIPSDYYCNGDYLKIGPINEQIYCSSTDTKDLKKYTAELTNSQHQLFIVFNSTTSGLQGRGFKIYYQYALDRYGNNITTPSSFMETTSKEHLVDPGMDDARYYITTTSSFDRFPPAEQVIDPGSVTCGEHYKPCGYGEAECYKEQERCDTIWNCPLHGGDERGCSVACWKGFTCSITSGGCYNESDRCNGKAVCINGRDEINCSPEQCSSDKGLFLCKNKQCIYEKWKCDRLNDCLDNSDEDDCSLLTSPKIIIAASAVAILCTLVLVITLSCLCKLYRKRVQQLSGGPQHETPLSRQLAEMFQHRAPPPPYHEAMLSSRPYDEASVENFSESENILDTSADFEAWHQENDDQSDLEQGLQQQSQTRRQRLSPRRSPELDNHTEMRNMFSFLENSTECPGDVHIDSRHHEEPPSYSETDPAFTAPGGIQHHGSWHGGFENFAYVDNDDTPHTTTDRDFDVWADRMLSDTVQNPSDQASTVFTPPIRNSDIARPIHENQHICCSDENDYDKGGDSTSLSSDLSREITNHATDVIDEDSDSDCILAENEGDDNGSPDSTGSDTTCILKHV